MEHDTNIHDYSVKYPSHAKLVKYMVCAKDRTPEHRCMKIEVLVRSSEE